MRAKRLDIQAIFLGLAVIAGVPAAAEAQLQGGVWRLSPQPNRPAAVQAKPKPTVVVIPGQTIHHRRVFPRFPVAMTLVPAIIMSDGTVIANFGFGFEPVFRSCFGGVVVGQPLVVTGQPTVIAGNGVVLSQSTAPTYTQPVPNQMTASQLMAQANLGRNGFVLSSVAQSACFHRDATGRVFVFRF